MAAAGSAPADHAGIVSAGNSSSPVLKTENKLTVQSADIPNANNSSESLVSESSDSGIAGSAENETKYAEAANVNGTVSENARKAEVAAYVYNDDDDSLDVSLYIDSVPKGKADVSSGEEETFGNFSLDQGIHRFKIIWKDEDTEKLYESEIKKDIKGDDAVSLYTAGHNEPEEYDLTVSVKNENDREITAYLYVDGIYQDSQDISEESTDDFSSASVEEGVHDVSFKWLDPYTNDQYEKTKRVAVEGDSAVIFVASIGTSFQDLGVAEVSAEATKGSESSGYSASLDSSFSSPSSSNSLALDDPASNDSKSINGDSGAADGEKNDSIESIPDSEVSQKDTIEDYITDDRQTGTGSESAENSAEEANSPYSMKTLSTVGGWLGDIEGKEDGANEASGGGGWLRLSPIYVIVLLAAAYVVLRH